MKKRIEIKAVVEVEEERLNEFYQAIDEALARWRVMFFSRDDGTSVFVESREPIILPTDL